MREFNTNESIESLYRLDYLRTKEIERLKDSKCPIGHLESTPGNLLVEFICYSLMPNHFHFLLKQLTENGISKYLHKLMMGYTKYFNYKNNRTGSLFGGTYKAIHITTDEYLLYLSSYINGNPEIHGVASAENWLWSSNRDFLGLRPGTLANKEIILKDFSGAREYREYTNSAIKGARERKDDIKRFFLE